MNKLIFDKVSQRMKDKKLSFSFREDMIHLDMGMRGTIGTLHMIIDIQDDMVVSYAILPNQVPEEKRAVVGEYLHRANYGVQRGNFEMDFNDGEVRYKLAADIYDPRTITNKLVDLLILIPCLMFKRYGEGVMKLIYGDGIPEKLIAEIEGN